MHKFYIISLSLMSDVLSQLECLFKNDDRNPNWLFYGSSNGNCLEILSPIDKTNGRECGQDIVTKENGCSDSTIDGLGDGTVRFFASVREAYATAISENSECGVIWAVNKRLLEEVYEGYLQVEIKNRGDEGIEFNEFAKLLVKNLKENSRDDSKVQRMVSTLHGVVPLNLETHEWFLVPFNKKDFMTDLYETLKINPYRHENKEVDWETLEHTLPEVAVVKAIIHRYTSTPDMETMN